MSIGKDGFHYLVPGPAPTVVGLRPFAAAFVTLAASSDGVAVSHTAAPRLQIPLQLRGLKK